MARILNVGRGVIGKARKKWGNNGVRSGLKNPVNIGDQILRGVTHEVGVDLERDFRVGVPGEVLDAL